MSANDKSDLLALGGLAREILSILLEKGELRTREVADELANRGQPLSESSLRYTIANLENAGIIGRRNLGQKSNGRVFAWRAV